MLRFAQNTDDQVLDGEIVAILGLQLSFGYIHEFICLKLLPMFHIKYHWFTGLKLAIRNAQFAKCFGSL